MSVTRYHLTTKEEVEAKRKELGTPVVYIFGAKNCGPCKRLSQDLEKFATDMTVNIFELKVPEFQDMDFYAKEYGITAFPKVIIVDENNNFVDEQESYSNINRFGSFLLEHKKTFSK